MLDISKLRFFNKGGYDLNLQQVNGVYKGQIILPSSSVGLYSSTQIYIMEEVDDDEFVFPFSDVENENIVCTWDYSNTFVDEIFLYNFTIPDNIPQDTSSLTYEIQDGPDIDIKAINVFDEYIIPLDYSGNSDSDSDVNTSAIPLFVAFNTNPKDDATTYERTLFIEYNGTRVAEIEFYAESIDEDERLKILNENLGYNITKEDSLLFKNADIREPLDNFELLNEKRKEMLMEGHNIYPFVGSYKALVNAIKFFGYDNVGISEFWRNVDKNSPYYGKLFKSSKYTLTKKEKISVNGLKIELPNDSFKKTKRIALTYNINKLIEEYDEYELPVTEYTFGDNDFETALFKLFGLRKKLDKEFMPGDRRITDVIGEGDYFGLNAVSNSSGYQSTLVVEEGVKVDFNISKKNLFIEDDRLFYTYLLYSNSENSDSNDFFSVVTDREIVLKDIDNIKLENISNVSVDDILNEVSMGSKLIVEKYNEFIKLPVPSEVDNDLSFINDEFFDHKVPCSAKVVLSLTSDVDTEYITELIWKVTYNGGEWEKEIRGGVDNYSSVFVQLPFIGDYDVELTAIDGYNTYSTVKKEKEIVVKPLNIEMEGVYHDARGNSESEEYDEHKKQLVDYICKDAILLNTVRSLQHEGLDELNQKLPVYTPDGKISRSNPYILSNFEDGMFDRLDNLNYTIMQFEGDYRTAFYIYDGIIIKPMTSIFLTVNKSKIPGRHDILWRVTNIDNGDVFTHMGEVYYQCMKHEGRYVVEIALKDSNNNICTLTRNLVTVSMNGEKWDNLNIN